MRSHTDFWAAYADSSIEQTTSSGRKKQSKTEATLEQFNTLSSRCLDWYEEKTLSFFQVVGESR